MDLAIFFLVHGLAGEALYTNFLFLFFFFFLSFSSSFLKHISCHVVNHGRKSRRYHESLFFFSAASFLGPSLFVYHLPLYVCGVAYESVWCMCLVMRLLSRTHTIHY
ncbi:hypothetical protein V8C37DRAFT_96035 [Trichoderma ceciliae]